MTIYIIRWKDAEGINRIFAGSSQKEMKDKWKEIRKDKDIEIEGFESALIKQELKGQKDVIKLINEEIK